MDIFRCPVCGHKIGVFQKYRQSLWGGIKCSSCGAQLHIRKTGTGRGDAFIPLAFVYFFLGIKEWIIPAAFCVGFVYDFIKCSLSPLIPLEQDQKANGAVWAYFFISTFYLLVALALLFVEK